MPTIKKNNAASQFQVDEGEYNAIVKKIEEKSGEHGNFYAWSFKIINPTLDGEAIENEMNIGGLTPAFLKDGYKLDNWLRACGVVIEDQGVADLDDAVGKKVRVMISDYEKRDKSGNMQVYSRVEKVMALKKRAEKPVEDEEEAEEPKAAPKATPKASPKEEPEAEPKKTGKKTDEDLFDFDD